MYPFDAFVVLLPVDGSEPTQAFQVVGTDGPEGIFTVSQSIPPHIQDLVATVSPSAQPEPSACRPDGFVQALRMVLYDYEPIDSPRQLAKLADLVVIGRVVDASPVPSETRGTDSLLTIEVREVVRGDAVLVVDGRILVRATNAEPAAGALEGVAGCDVFLFLSLVDGGAATPGIGAGPDVFGTSAQGFWIQSNDALIGVHVPLDSNPPGWNGIASIDDLRDASAYTFEERDAAQLAVIGAVNSDPDNFGGIYIDRDGGALDGALVILYVGDNAGRAPVEQTITPAVTVRWVKVERNAAELERIRTEIRERDLPGVILIYTDTIGNRVGVGIAEDSMEEVSQLLASEYGEAVYAFESEVPTLE
jgi:hypothetical protein